MEIWNNPACSKCAAARDTVSRLDVGPVRLRPYLEEPPTAQELSHVLDRLGAQPWDVCRLGEPVAEDLGLAEWARDGSTRQAWIEIMVANPVLIQRPIVLFDDGTALVARDSDALAAVLVDRRSAATGLAGTAT